MVDSFLTLMISRIFIECTSDLDPACMAATARCVGSAVHATTAPNISWRQSSPPGQRNENPATFQSPDRICASVSTVRQKHTTEPHLARGQPVIRLRRLVKREGFDNRPDLPLRG